MRSFHFAPALGALCALAFFGSAAQAAPITATTNTRFIPGPSVVPAPTPSAFSGSGGTVIVQDGRFNLIVDNGALGGSSIHTFGNALQGSAVVTDLGSATQLVFAPDALATQTTTTASVIGSAPGASGGTTTPTTGPAGGGAQVPEPASLSLLVLGLGALGGVARRRLS